MIAYTERLAEFAAGAALERIPAEVKAYAKLLLLDQLGCELAFSGHPWSRGYRDGILELGAGDGATVLGYGDRASVDNAAFLNSAFGHGDEFDDTHIKSPTHPGAVIIPAAVAVAENRHANGAALLQAIIVGYEIMLRLSSAGSPLFHERGHHSPTCVGPFGAAIAAARIYGLDKEGCLHALAIASSHAAGLLEYTQAGGSVKRIHCAIPAQAGVRSAMFAKQGITGPRSALEGTRGFFAVFPGGGNLELLTDRLGEYWRVMEVGFKPYNCCYYIHAPIEALDALIAKHHIGADDIEKITIGSSDQGTRHTGIIKEPIDILAAQFSNSFSLAIRLLRGSNSSADYREEDLHDPKFLELSRRIETIVDPISEAEHPNSFGALVTIQTRDGRRLEHRERFSRGLPEKPMSEADLIAKFMDLATPKIGRAAAEDVVAMVRDLENLSDVSKLVELLVTNNAKTLAHA